MQSRRLGPLVTILMLSTLFLQAWVPPLQDGFHTVTEYNQNKPLEEGGANPYELHKKLLASTPTLAASQATVVTPADISFAMSPGASQNFQITIQTASSPVEKADILFLFDVTSSMAAELDEAKKQGMDIMNSLRKTVPDASFGVASFADYPDDFIGHSGTASDYPWHLDQDITSDTKAVERAINGLSLQVGGTDTPESYSRALNEAMTIGWRPDNEHIIVIFGDAPGHDPDPGPDGLLGTSDDLVFSKVVAQLKEQKILVMPVDSGGDSNATANFQYMAEQTGGKVYPLSNSTDLATVVIDGLKNATSNISSLFLQADPKYQDWLTFSPDSYSNVAGNTQKTFNATLKVSSDSVVGPYKFNIQAMGDGIVLGNTEVGIDVGQPTQTPTPSKSDLISLDVTAVPDTANVNEPISIEIRLSGDNTTCGESVVAKPVDVILVLDHSGSMDGEKLSNAKKAAQAFLQQMNLTADRVGVVEFDFGGQLLQAPSTDLKTLNQAIEDISLGSGTDISAGVQVAMQTLDDNRRADVVPVIILLSDGQSDFDSAKRMADNAKAKGMRIVTVGVGDSDETIMKGIASLDNKGQPKYYYAPDPSKLQDIYLSIARDIREYGLAKELTLRHQVDLYKYAIVPASLNPAGEIQGDTIVWHKDFLESGESVFTFQVLGRQEGEHYEGIFTEAAFLECEQNNRFVRTEAAPLITISPAPATSCEQTCPWWKTFPWWLLIPLLLALIFFLVLWLSPLGRKLWQKPLICKLIAIATMLYLVLLSALIAHALLGNLCQSDHIFFWKIIPVANLTPVAGATPVGDVGIYSTNLGDQTTNPVRELNRASNCVACHSIGNGQEKPFIGAVTNDQNGPILIKDLQGNELPIPPIQGSYLAWSPDGKAVAVSVDDKDIQILDLATGALTPLKGASDPNVVETMPSWSPDGKTIAFVRAAHTAKRTADIDVAADIYTVSAAGGTPLPLPGASGEGFSYYPSYSPDGRWLAFTHHVTGKHTYADGASDVYILPVAGGTPILLRANSPLADSWPAWSPDSKRLGFDSKRNGQFDIFIAEIGANGQSGKVCQLPGASSEQDIEFHPVWLNVVEKTWQESLLALWPWLIPLLLLLALGWWFCREIKSVLVVEIIDATTGLPVENAKVIVSHTDKNGGQK